MDWNRVEGNWKQKKGKIKGKLTDDDLDQIAGQRDQLEGKTQGRYGIERSRVRSDVDDWYGRQQWPGSKGCNQPAPLVGAGFFVGVNARPHVEVSTDFDRYLDKGLAVQARSGP